MDAVRQGYDRWAASYDDHDPSTEIDEPLLLELAGPLEGCRVLDVACGTGRYARLLQRAGAKVIGIDVSRGMLGRAHSLRVLQARSDRLPFAERSFDLVSCGLLFDHLRELRPTLREMARVARQRVVISTIHPAMLELTGATVDAPTYLHSLDALERDAAACDLHLVERREPHVASDHPRWRWRTHVPALAVFSFAR